MFNESLLLHLENQLLDLRASRFDNGWSDHLFVFVVATSRLRYDRHQLGRDVFRFEPGLQKTRQLSLTEHIVQALALVLLLHVFSPRGEIAVSEDSAWFEETMRVANDEGELVSVPFSFAQRVSVVQNTVKGVVRQGRNHFLPEALQRRHLILLFLGPFLESLEDTAVTLDNDVFLQICFFLRSSPSWKIESTEVIFNCFF